MLWAIMILSCSHEMTYSTVVLLDRVCLCGAPEQLLPEVSGYYLCVYLGFDDPSTVLLKLKVIDNSSKNFERVVKL